MKVKVQLLLKITFAAVFLLMAACSSTDSDTDDEGGDMIPDPGTLQAGTDEAGLLAASQNAAQHTAADVFTHMSQGPVTLVEGARATLVSNDNGGRVIFKTLVLAPGHAHTMWFVVVNAPENCSEVPCTTADVLGNTDAVKANVAYGTGSVVGGSGKATFATHFPAGPLPGGWYDNDFTNPRERRFTWPSWITVPPSRGWSRTR